MTKSASKLLSSKEVARFVARGFLRYDALLDSEVCAGLLAAPLAYRTGSASSDRQDLPFYKPALRSRG